VTETSFSTSGAWAAGVATLAPDGRVLDAWYPSPSLVDAPPGDLVRSTGTVRLTAATAADLLGSDVSGALGRDELGEVERIAVGTYIESLADPPVDTHDAWLRLHLLSHRCIAPNQADLTDLFGLLNTVVWTSTGPYPPEGFDRVQLRARSSGRPVEVLGVDKFPRMTDYVVPSGVRVADASRVRLGAHLAEGTVVMHEGFVNFNAGTLGAAMIEGRISAGVVVGDGSDLGGGSSLMGTLSGGGKEVVRVGQRCLVGANGGIGISLGDDCVVEAGLYVTAGTRVTLPDGQVVKARELSGADALLFRRNSTTGTVEVLPRAGSSDVELNAALHQT
jgi:2,3,4,5-tetrahydropyridine-2-carboxylate N-succinyltransferase